MGIERGLPKGFSTASREDSDKIYHLIQEVKDLVLREDNLYIAITALIYSLGLTIASGEYDYSGNVTIDEKLDVVRKQLKTIINESLENIKREDDEEREAK